MGKYFYIHVLKSLKDNKFYTGYTKNIKQRLEQHNKRLVKSTKYRFLFILVYFEGCLNMNDALQREKYLKTYYGKKYIKNRLKSYLTG